MQLLQDRRRLFLILNFVIFLIPVNVYVIGDWLGTGIQWILFRYQSTYLGDSILDVWKDLMYVMSGTMGWKTSIAWSLWVVAAGILVLSLIVHLLNYLTSVDGDRITGIIILAGSFLLLVSDLVQYGILFNGPAGFCIPLGIPLIMVCGWLLIRESEPVTVSGWWDNLRLAFSKSRSE